MANEENTCTTSRLPSSSIDGGGVTMDVTIVTNDSLLDVSDTEEAMVPYKNIRIKDDLWEARLQDIP